MTKELNVKFVKTIVSVRIDLNSEPSFTNDQVLKGPYFPILNVKHMKMLMQWNAVKFVQ